MYHKINQIIDDISNEIDVYETSEAKFYKEMFLKRLKYNIKDIKTLVVQEIQAEERMLNDLHRKAEDEKADELYEINKKEK